MEDIQQAALAPMLYLCATPIGNLEDITLRAVRILKNVSCIYCEDTRRTATLLNRLSIKKPLIACHSHNENARAEEIVHRVRSGEAVAFVSDAGMPGISDPGERLVAACIAHNVPFTVLPGPSASLAALVLSGLPSCGACFYGFLPREPKPRRTALAALSEHRGTLIFYESPLRLAATCAELVGTLGDRSAALVREITKIHEETVRAPLSALAARYAETPPRGECVLLVSGAPDAPGATEEDALAMLAPLLQQGLRAKDAAKEVSAAIGISRNEVYRLALQIKQKEEKG